MFHEWNPTGTQGHSLWVNPPFEMWPEVAEKVVNAQVRCLCCIPDWGSPLLDDLVPLAARRLYIPAGSSVFQYGGGKCPPTKWGLWLLDIPAQRRKNPGGHHGGSVGCPYYP